MSDLFNEAYYAAASAPTRLPESKAESRLRQVLTTEAFDVVSETVKRWNVPLRSEVRAVTALKLADDSGRTTANIPVAVIDGMPNPLAEATSDLELWQWWLVLHRPALEQADQGLKLIVDQKDVLSQFVSDVPSRIDSISLSRAFIDDILKHSIDEDILERFKKIEEDIFGAYWIHASKIQLYWMPLAIFASLFRVSLSTLTAAVLCHELVHAYSHRGVDIDGSSWSTDCFIRTDIFVKEGLAQYYTEQIMRALGARLPDGLATFLAKTSKQSAPYTTYQNWLSDKKQPSPEAVRLAMLEFRNSEPPIFGHDEFQRILKSAQARIRGSRQAR
jgi:hypothetical protein